MSVRSELSRIERFFPAELGDADSPMNAYTAYSLRNNLNHLIDESPQLIICSATTTASPIMPLPESYMGGTGTSVGIWSQEFVHTWIRPDRPTNLDLLVYAQSELNTKPMTVTARCVPAHFPIGDASAPDIFTEAGVTASGATTGTATSDKVIDVKAIFTTAQPKFLSAHTTLGTLAGLNTKVASVSVAIMRLEIKFTYTDPAYLATQLGGMALLMLREFC